MDGEGKQVKSEILLFSYKVKNVQHVLSPRGKANQEQSPAPWRRAREAHTARRRTPLTTITAAPQPHPPLPHLDAIANNNGTTLKYTKTPIARPGSPRDLRPELSTGMAIYEKDSTTDPPGREISSLIWCHTQVCTPSTSSPHSHSVCVFRSMEVSASLDAPAPRSS